MKFQKLQPFVVLLAGLIVSVDNILSRRAMTKSLLILLATVVGFYIITSFALKIINKVITEKQKADQEAEDDDYYDDDEDEEDEEAQAEDSPEE